MTEAETKETLQSILDELKRLNEKEDRLCKEIRAFSLGMLGSERIEKARNQTQI